MQVSFILFSIHFAVYQHINSKCLYRTHVKYKANTWRTLTKNEWEYLLFKRISAAAFWGLATVNNIHGLILLPDDFTLPKNMTFVAGDDISLVWKLNVYTTYEWEKMEKSGAVFLPASGYRYGSSFDYVQVGGSYWSATPYDSSYASCLSFYSHGADWLSYSRCYGRAVRLVQDL